MVLVTCNNKRRNCTYQWQTKTKLQQATCPNCNAKVPIPKAEQPPINTPVTITNQKPTTRTR